MMNDTTIPATEWAKFLDEEYLSEYISQGGSAVKFAVCKTKEAVDSLTNSLNEFGARHHYATVVLDAKDFRAHMPQDVYFQIAAQIDWRGLVRERILQLAHDALLKIDGIATAGNDDLYGSLAKKNRITRQEVVQELREQISAKIFRRRCMTRDFRVAMAALCKAENATDSESYNAGPVLDWLMGQEKRVSAIRPFSIYGTIDRTTARGMLESTLHWLLDCGQAGLIVVLDNRRVLTTPNPKDGFKYYTRMMVFDHYEVLRELIDDIDRLPGLLLIVTTCAQFVQANMRSYREYQALSMRIMNDVRDEQKQNWAAALVNVS
ncbi:MAG: DUF2791 family P-loop domain-containing protein [Bryobacterales bacterium]|nr:DUF2791 family P-loop domain-containing protein [Bryobacterales bacterium]